jgi:hypothetical protein
VLHARQVQNARGDCSLAIEPNERGSGMGAHGAGQAVAADEDFGAGFSSSCG